MFVPRLVAKALPGWLVAGSLLGAAACSPIDRTLDVAAGPAGAEGVIDFGLAMIQDRYLEPVVIGDIAFEGMRGLSKIDAAVTIDRPEPRHLILFYRKEMQAEYTAPADDDADGWSRLIVAVRHDASAVSRQLRDADDDIFCQAVLRASLARLDRFSRYVGPDEARRRRAVRDGAGADPEDAASPAVTMSLARGVATIGISTFRHGTADRVARDLVEAEGAPGFKGVVLDLRGTPGGRLDEGVAVARLFIDHGSIGLTRGRNPSSIQIYDAIPGEPGKIMPLIVLVDGGSASAAEILAAALQDSGRAVLVGTNTYGKGTVQTVIRMPNDGEMTLSWARFYGPSGYPLHGLGVLPTICTADDAADPAALLASVTKPHPAVAANIAVWRATTIDETALRGRLRAVCPAGRHGHASGDLAVARDLINDQSLYQRALALTAPVAALATTALVTPRR